MPSPLASLRWEASDVEEPAERFRVAVVAALLLAAAIILVRATGKPEAAILLLTVSAFASGRTLRSRPYWITPEGVTTHRSVRETVPWAAIRAAERRGRAVLLRTDTRRLHRLTLPRDPDLRETALTLLLTRLPRTAAYVEP